MAVNSVMNKKVRVSDNILLGLIYLSAFLAVGLLVGIICYVFYRGIGNLSLAFLVTEQSPTKGIMGIAGNIVNTLYIVILTLIVVTPIGVGGAIYLNEYAKPGRLVSTIEFTIEVLTGIPSIIFGLFGSAGDDVDAFGSEDDMYSGEAFTKTRFDFGLGVGVTLELNRFLIGIGGEWGLTGNKYGYYDPIDDRGYESDYKNATYTLSVGYCF